MIFNTSSAEVLDLALERSTHQALVRQIIFAILGCGFSCIIWIVGYQQLLRMITPLFWIVTFLLLLVLIPGIGMRANGAARWLSLGGYSLQPSELAKFTIPCYFIYQVTYYEGMSLRRFLKLVALTCVPMGLVLLEPDNGTTGIIGLSLLSVFVITEIPLRFWGVPMLILMLVGGVVAVNMPYVQARLRVYMNPELDIRGKGHQAYQAKIAAGSGQILGRGPGMSLQKLSYLPEAQNDYIAAIYAEELGFVGMILLISLYMLIAFLGVYISHQAIDREGFYLGTVITFLICIQAFLNLGVVSGLLPSTGINLPLFSQGGTSLIANISGLAVLLQISALSEKKQKQNLLSVR